MLTYGFYNSQGGDRKYDATQLSSIFDGIITDGIFRSIGTSLVVLASTGRTVVVGEGRAWFDHTWTLVDAPFPLTLDASDAILKRIDTIVLDVDTRTTNRTNNLIVVKGTPSSSPVAPTLIQAGGRYQYPLCNIFVGNGVTSIIQSNITNRVGTVDTPYVSVIDASNEIGARTYSEENYVANDELISESIDALDIKVKAAIGSVAQGVANLTASKQPNITGAASTVVENNLTASKVLVSNGSGKIAAASISEIELGYLAGLTANVQTQLALLVSNVFGASKVLITDALGKLATAAVSATELSYLVGVTGNIQTQINNLTGGSLTASRVIVTDALGKLSAAAITATELSYLSGLSSNIQVQLSNLTGQSFTANKAVKTDAAGKLIAAGTNSTEIEYLVGVTSAIQGQINGKQPTISGAATTITTSNLTANRVLLSDGSGKVAASTITDTILGYLANVASDIQTQINSKLASTAQAADSLKVGGKKLTVGTSAPASPAVGDLWVDTN